MIRLVSKQRARSVYYSMLLFGWMLYSSHPLRAEEGWTDLIGDANASFSEPYISKPAYLEAIIDPVFGTKIIRIKGDPGKPIPNINGGIWGTVSEHHYSKDQPWNADGSLIHITRNDGGNPDSLFLDGENYKVLFSRDVPEDSRWHPTDPDLKIYVGGNRIGYFNVRTGQNAVLLDSDKYNEMHAVPSPDGRRVLWRSNWDNSESRPIQAYICDASAINTGNHPNAPTNLRLV